MLSLVCPFLWYVMTVARGKASTDDSLNFVHLYTLRIKSFSSLTERKEDTIAPANVALEVVSHDIRIKSQLDDL